MEKRDDVLVYTSGTLTEDVTIVGEVKLIVYVRSSTFNRFDIFGRLCDVDTEGISRNVCDGLHRMDPIAGNSCSVEGGGGVMEMKSPAGESKRFTITNEQVVHKVEVDMWATAKKFLKGHRIRLQVSSGAHPRWLRNYGSGVPVLDAKSSRDMEMATIRIIHDRNHPSAVILPIMK